MPYIYVLRDLTGIVRYVGITRNLKSRQSRYRYKGHTKHLDNWLKSSLGSPIPHKIAEVIEENAYNAERFWISYFRMLGANLLNHTDGGEVGFSMDENTRKRIGIKTRQRMLGSKHSEITKLKMSKTRMGHSVSQKSLEALITRNKERAGRKLSEEHKAKLKAIWTPERRAKFSETSKNQWIRKRLKGSVK